MADVLDIKKRRVKREKLIQWIFRLQWTICQFFDHSNSSNLKSRNGVCDSKWWKFRKDMDGSNLRQATSWAWHLSFICPIVKSFVVEWNASSDSRNPWLVTVVGAWPLGFFLVYNSGGSGTWDDRVALLCQWCRAHAKQFHQQKSLKIL